MMQECAAKWRGMDDEGKKPYQALADKDKERWLTEKAAEKKPKDQWRPKRPPSAYFLFLKDFRASWKLETEAEELEEEDAQKIAERLSGGGTPESVDNTALHSPSIGENGGTEETPAKTPTHAGDGEDDKSNGPDEENNLKIDESKHDNAANGEKNIPENALNPAAHALSQQTGLPVPLPAKKLKKERKTSRVVVSFSFDMTGPIWNLSFPRFG